MDGENKILKIIFFVLMIAVIGEVIYLFAIPKIQPEQTENTIGIPPAPVPVSYSGPTNKEMPPLFNLKALDEYSTIPLYPNTKASVSIESRNLVSDVLTDSVSQGGRNFPLSVKIDYGSGIERWVRYEQNDIAKMKIYLDEGGGGIKKPANFADMKKGDTILLKSILNPFFPPGDNRYLVELEINIIR